MADPSPLYYPMLVKLARRKCVIVGGGKVGWRKAAALLEAGADVVVISPDAVPDLRQAANDGLVQWIQRNFRPADLDGAALAFAAANEPVVNEQVHRAAALAGVWVNRSDASEDGDFIVPAAYRNGRLILSAATGGASPGLAKRIVREWADRYGPEYKDYIEVLDELRRRVIAEQPSEEQKRTILAELLDRGLLDLIKGGKPPRDVLEAEWRSIKERNIGNRGR